MVTMTIDKGVGGGGEAEKGAGRERSQKKEHHGDDGASETDNDTT